MARELTPDGREDTGRETASLGRRGYLAVSGMVAATGSLLGLVRPSTASSPAARADADADEHTLVVEGTGDTSTYEVTVSDAITPLSAGDALSTVGTDGPAAEGVVGGDARGYRFTGDITDVRVDGRVSLYVDGVSVSYDSI